MASLKDKLLYTIRSFLPDSVPLPQSPRPVPTDNVTKTEDSSEIPQKNQEFVHQEARPESPKEENQQKTGKKKKSHQPGSAKAGKDQVVVNTQAGRDVIVITHSTNVHVGPVFHMGINPESVGKTKQDDECDKNIEKNNLIVLVMEAKIKPVHEYIDYISKNLGKNWHSFFRALGFTKGKIETMEIDEGRNGVSEARYKLLLDWARNDDDGTLGCLTTKLWEEGEREIVKELAIIYKANMT